MSFGFWFYNLFRLLLALLQNGADPTIRNSDGKTALDLADPGSTAAIFTGEYMKHQLLEAARSGNEERYELQMFLLCCLEQIILLFLLQSCLYNVFTGYCRF